MHRRLESGLVPLLFLTVMVPIRCASGPPMDYSPTALAGRDKTLIFQKADATSSKGYLFVQKTEGTSLDEPVTLVVPDTDCKRESCADYQFFNRDGTPGAKGAFPKGATKSALALSEVVGHAGVAVSTDEGEYSVALRVFYLDQTGAECSEFFNGFIRLNILAPGYTSPSCGDPSTAWVTPIQKDCQAQFTNAGRSALCGPGCAVGVIRE